MMPSIQDYRFYFLDEAGHVRAFQQHDCVDDEAAVALGQQIAASEKAAALEIWSRARLVIRIERPKPS